MSALGRIAREPLVHFLLLGAALFAAERWRRPAAAPAGGPVVVTAALRAELADGWTRAQGSPPTPEELETLVAAWIDEEILYREGVARGLERGDAKVRRRAVRPSRRHGWRCARTGARPAGATRWPPPSPPSAPATGS